MRVPVRVKDDDGVGGLQVEAEASCSSAQEEDEIFGLGVVEGLQQHSSVFGLCGAWQDKIHCQHHVNERFGLVYV